MTVDTVATKGPLDLKREVMQANLCTSCGLCASFCPYIKAVGDKVAVIWDCGRKDEARCYTVCPRTSTDIGVLDARIFGKSRSDYVLGQQDAVLMARSKLTEAANAGQYGGVVSALMFHQLDSQSARAAVLTATKDGPIPSPMLAHDHAEVLAAAGSKYGACPSLVALNKAVKDEPGPVAVVGRPCQVTAVRKWQAMPDQPEATKVGLVVGLFCFWALSYKFYDYLATKAPLATIKKVDLPKEDFVAYTEDGEIHLPLEEVRPFIKPTCNQCFDVTAELADLSVGSTEFDYAWNTLIVRTARGKAALEEAIAKGYLETKPLPPEREELLRTVVRNKKRRVLDALRGNGGYGYLQIDGAVEPEIMGGS